MEAEIGLIGVGFNTDEINESAGLYISSGYKFVKTPDFYSSRTKYAHILKGAYVKPQILLTFYRNESEYYFFNSGGYDDLKRDVFGGAFVINLGKQIIYDNAFLIDYSAGLGYGFVLESNFSPSGSETNERGYHYGFAGGANDFPIAVTFRVKVGLLWQLYQSNLNH